MKRKKFLKLAAIRRLRRMDPRLREHAIKARDALADWFRDRVKNDEH